MRELDVAHRRRPLRIGNDDLVAGLEQRVAEDEERVDAADGHEDFVRAGDRDAVLAS